LAPRLAKAGVPFIFRRTPLSPRGITASMKFLKLFLFALLTLATSVSAEVLYNLTFDSPTHRVGERPTVGPGPSGISGIVFGSPRVVNDQPLLDGNCLEFEGYTSYEQISLNTAGARGVITVDYDVVTKNVIGSLYGFTVLLDTPIVRTLTFHGPLQRIHAFMPGAGGMLQPFQDNRRYHVRMVVDTEANSWKISVDGVQQYQSVFDAASVEHIRLSFSPVYGMAGDEPTAKTYVDNFKVTTGSLASAPSVQDLKAIDIGTRSAWLNASVNPSGADTTATFAYRTGSGEWIFTKLISVPAISGSTVVKMPIDSLLPGTKYQIKLTATNVHGSTSQESEFTTRPVTPVAQDDTFHTPSGREPFQLPVKANDLDESGLGVVVLPNAGESGYDSRVTTDGTTVTFHPTPGFDGNASFSYILTNGAGSRSTATVRLTNTAPKAEDVRVSMRKEDSSVIIDTAFTVSDEDGDYVFLVDVQSPASGSATRNGSRITFTPGPKFSGFDSFTYKVSDGRGGEATGRIYVMFDHPHAAIAYQKGDSIEGLPGDQWKSFGTPSVFDGGKKIGWLAKVKGQTRNYDGIFSGSLDSVQLQLRSDQPATDESGNPMPDMVFSSFKNPVFAADDFAFGAVILNPDAPWKSEYGLWVNDSGHLRRLARMLGRAPGLEDGYFKDIESIAMPAADSLFYTASLWPGYGGVTEQDDRGLWVWKKNSPTVCALREGVAIPGYGRVESFRTFSAASGTAAHGRYDQSRPSVDVLVRFHDGRSAIMQIDVIGSRTIIASSGELVSNWPLTKFGMPSSPGAGQAPVATALFPESPNAKPRLRALMNFANRYMLAFEGETAPGTESERFVDFKDPVACIGRANDASVAFEASLQGGSPGTNAGIWWLSSAELAPMTLVARKGAPAPGAEGQVFRDFKSLSVVDYHGPLFTASLAPGNDLGCWATDANGALHLILRTGDVVGGKTIRSFQVLNTVAESPGQRRAWAATPDVATVIFRVVFTNNSEGIVTVTYP